MQFYRGALNSACFVPHIDASNQTVYQRVENDRPCDASGKGYTVSARERWQVLEEEREGGRGVKLFRVGKGGVACPFLCGQGRYHG